MKNSLEFIGGSMSSVEKRGKFLAKSYSGSIHRGHEKLEKEQIWFRLLPSIIKNSKNKMFPETKIDRVDENERKQTTMFIEMIDRITISKCIIFGCLSPELAVEWFSNSIGILFDKLYPLRMAVLRENTFEQYHRQRLIWAEKAFRSHVELSGLFAEETIYINGQQCSGPNSFCDWGQSSFIKECLSSNKLFAIHGNLHFDNILIDSNKTPNRNHITFIDPRGDLVGPLHYDSGKLFTTVHSHYDEIHYDYYDLEQVGEQNYYLTISNRFEKHYGLLQESVLNSLSRYAQLQTESYENFLLATMLCEAIHTYSFAAYHLNRKNPNIKRVKAYLLISCLLRKKIENHLTADAKKLDSYYQTRLLVRKDDKYCFAK